MKEKRNDQVPRFPCALAQCESRDHKRMDQLIKYKRAVMFLISLVLLFCHMAVFWYVWNRFFSMAIIQPFYRKGNWLMVAVYCCTSAMATSWSCTWNRLP